MWNSTRTRVSPPLSPEYTYIIYYCIIIVISPVRVCVFVRTRDNIHGVYLLLKLDCFPSVLRSFVFRFRRVSSVVQPPPLYHILTQFFYSSTHSSTVTLHHHVLVRTPWRVPVYREPSRFPRTDHHSLRVSQGTFFCSFYCSGDATDVLDSSLRKTKYWAVVCRRKKILRFCHWWWLIRNDFLYPLNKWKNHWRHKFSYLKCPWNWSREPGRVDKTQTAGISRVDDEKE